MITLKLHEQMELLFSPEVSWTRLSPETRHEIITQLSLLLLSYLGEEIEQIQSKEDQLCQAK